MDVDLHDIHSASLEKSTIQDVLKSLSRAVADAGDARDLEQVNNPELRKALNIVEEFLRKAHRVCYGGMAINAQLPKSLKFYDFSKTLPDYDFFTPSPEKDVEVLVDMLKTAGFTEVAARMGMHEGTMKVFVNYTGVADITFCPQWMFQQLKRRAIEDDGILYADADFLRMNMYLELSRPRGEVERWDKVYKRLLLLNLAKDPRSTDACKRGSPMKRIDKELHERVMLYVQSHGLIFAGADLKRLYGRPGAKYSGFLLDSSSPVLAFSENPASHVASIRQIVNDFDTHGRITVLHWNAKGELFPEMWGIKQHGRLIAVVIDLEFCLSYNTVELPSVGPLRVASLDTAITLYYILTFVRGLDGIVPKSIHCFADQLVNISRRTRDRDHAGKFPLFVTTCAGHQPSKSSLLRAKAERVKAAKTRRVRRSGGRTLKRRTRDF
jgi:hypothetical protein